jgi:hypothetical protein
LAQVIENKRQLAIVVLTEKLLERLADRSEQRRKARNAFQHRLHDHTPPVGGIGDAPNQPLRFQAIDQTCHGRGGQSSMSGQFTGGAWALT